MIERAGIISRRDHDTLSKLARRQEKVAKSQAAQRAAELVADFEEQLARVYSSSDQRWRAVTAQASEMIAHAREEIRRICEAEGVRPAFAPSLNLQWSGRGENADKARRAELRKVAETRIEALRQKAVAAIEAKTVEFETTLAAGALESATAAEMLKAMPTAADLMPALNAGEIDRAIPTSTPEVPWYLSRTE